MIQGISIVALTLAGWVTLFFVDANRRFWFLGGGLTWALALVAKSVTGAGVAKLCQFAKRTTVRDAVWGAWSASCELGGTAIAFTCFGDASLSSAFLFGLGAASVENLYVLVVANSPVDSESAALFNSGPLKWFGVTDRAATTLGHVSARVVIWCTLQRAALLPLGLASFAIFAVVDALAVHFTSTGRWSRQPWPMRYMLFLLTAAVFDAALLVAAVTMVK